VLARSWSVPNIYAKGAAETYAPLLGKYVRLDARPDGFDIRMANPKEIVEVERRDIARTALVTPKADLAFDRLVGLSELRAADSVRVGAKAANLGEATSARIPGMTVPDGFAIPFAFYDRFVKATGIETEIFDMLDDQRFNHDVPYRRARLAALRDRVVAAPMPEDMASAIVERARATFGDQGLFVRSSTNAEDLPTFSGAGLYTTVPNVKGDAALVTAVKTVWASIWNDAAYEARSAAGMSHLVYPGVLVQLGMNADAAGVLVTTNPFDPADHGAVYINAKRGLGIRVVDGHKVAEQILYHGRTSRVRVLTRSADDTALTFDERGGVREVRVEPGRSVLTDDLARRLGRIANALERHFRIGPLDVEWLTIGDRIYVVQARPFAAS
jgi:phosphoenolpyruvate synthase/pyruvate phosphate dikinase